MGLVSIQDSTIDPKRERREIEAKVRETIQELNGFLLGENSTTITIVELGILTKSLTYYQRYEQQIKAELDNTHKDMDTIERNKILQILKDALTAGYTISVFDGAEVCIEKSDNILEIFRSMASTGQDILTFFKGEAKGCVLLIYGNGRDIISNYTDNTAIDKLLENAMNISE